MKRCPSCNRTYADLSLNFCLEDGTPLISDVPAADPNATLPYPPPRDTSEPPPTELYHPDSPALNQVRAIPQPRPWSPGPAPPQQKSNALWWILGGVFVAGIAGVGLIVVLVVLASIGSQMEANENSSNSNVSVVTRNTNNANLYNANRTETNTNTSPSAFSDDFSDRKWGTGTSRFGEIWYVDDEYHMRSKKETYLVMYAPSNDYATENATVKVTARSVDGSVPSAGFGLIVHGQQARNKGLQDYALLIYPGEDAKYEIITHRDGNQTALVPRTESSVIRSGTNPNQLEVRINGNDLSFYINGQYLTRITDSANFKSGVAGFYTSDTTEVAFDDLEIKRESSAEKL
jgi:cytoskeletal protein RodZ